MLRRRYRYDIAEMPECGAEGSLINRLVRLPTLVRLHSPARLIMPFYDVRETDITLCSLVEQAGMDAAGGITSCSRFLAGEARTKLGINRSIAVIPNGIDLELFDGQEEIDFRERFQLPRDRPILFFSGRIERRKGADLFPRIAREILERYPVAFVVAGQDLFDSMKREIQPELERGRLRGSFHYLGKLSLMEIRSGVRQCEIFLLPSLWENCPYSCLEAMAAGRAIVSTDQGGMPELISDGESGLLARSGDSGSFVTAIERLLRDDGLRDRLGRGARATVERDYRDVHTARVSVETYSRLIGAAA
jgi:glycosyltransferase involved in cell wall biosynthesis